MTQLSQDRRAGTLLVAMSAATLPHLLTPVAWLIPVFCGVGAWRLAAERGHCALPGPRLRNALGLGLLLLQGLIMLQYGATLAVATAMLVGFTWIKMLELRNLLDDQVLCLLCLLLIASYMLVNTGPAATTYAAVAATVGLVALQRCTDREAWRLSWGVAWRTTSRIVLVSLPLTILIFLVLPRFPVPVSFNTKQARSGVDDDLDPGAIAALAEDTGRAFTVSFPDGEVPPRSDWYWRGAVCWVAYGDLRWRTGPWKGAVMQQVEALQSADGQTWQQRIMLEPHQRKILFGLDAPETRPRGYYLAAGYDLRSREPIRRRVQYEVVSRSGVPLAALVDPQQEALQLPDDLDPRVRNLAASWQQAGSDRAIMQAGLRWFASQGFRYSRQPGDQGANPLVRFLFQRRIGFCEHYASSYALLMRAAGVPSRVVVGYRGGAWNPYGEFIEVLFRHAHAWCEVHLAGEGWVRVDPTITLGESDNNPLAALGAEADGGPPDENAPWTEHFSYEFGLWVDWVDFYWYQFVVGYDDVYQEMLLAAMGLGRYGWWGWGAVLLLAGVPLVLLGWWIGRRLPWGTDPQLQLLLRVCKRLGQPREPHEGVRAWAERVARQRPDLADVVLEFSDVWCRNRYGGETVARAELRRLVTRLSADASNRQRRGPSPAAPR